MKTKLLLLLLLSQHILFSQLSNIGMKEYGRIFNIQYDPVIENKLYATTLGNHIVVSIDNGENWDVLYSFPNNQINIQNLKILSNNKLSFTVCYSYGHNNLFILNLITLSIEKEFLIPITEGSTSEQIQSYSIYPADNDVVIVLQRYQIGFSSYAKVYYTNDGGQNWNMIYFNEDYIIFPNKVAISPSNPNKLFISRSFGPDTPMGGLFISEDAGTTWVEKLSGNAIGPIAFHPTDSNYILVGTDFGFGSHQENLYRSIDGGETWETMPIDWYDLASNLILDIQFHPNNPNKIIVLEEDQVIITNDNFLNHENHVYQSNSPESYYYGLNASFNPFNENQAFVGANYFPLFSNDGGATFIRKKNKFFVSQGNNYYHNGNSTSHFYYGLQFGHIHRDISNQIETTHDLIPVNIPVLLPTKVFYGDDNLEGRVYIFQSDAFGLSFNLKISNNHGNDFFEIPVNYEYLHAIKSNPNNPNVLWCSFTRTNLSGYSEYFLVEIDFTDINNVQQNIIPLPADGLITSIYINPSDTNEKIIAQGTKIFKTINNGLLWTDNSNGLESLTTNNGLIFSLNKNPLNSNQFAIASTDGIFISSDNTLNWAQVSNILTHQVNFSNINNGVLVGCAYDSDYSTFNLQYSSDTGNTWTTIQPESLYFLGSSSVSFNFLQNEIEVFISSRDLGILKYTVGITNLGLPHYPTKNITVAPNPFSDILKISSNYEDIIEISIYNLLGQKVKQLDSNVIGRNIDLSSLNNGIYNLVIVTKNKEVEVIRIVRN